MAWPCLNLWWCDGTRSIIRPEMIAAEVSGRAVVGGRVYDTPDNVVVSQRQQVLPGMSPEQGRLMVFLSESST